MDSISEPIIFVISVLASTINVFLGLLLFIVLARRQVHPDTVGNVTLNLVVVAVLSYSVVGLLFVFNWALTGKGVLDGVLCQVGGVFLSLSLLLPPATVAVRYMYFLWLVVLQRPIHTVRWVSGCVLVVGVIVIISVLPGLMGEYSPREHVLQCAMLYHTGKMWPRSMGFLLAIVIISGLLAHLIFNAFILAKLKRLSSPGLVMYPPSTALLSAAAAQTSRDAVIRKFFPVALAYILTHSAPLVLATVEVFRGSPAPIDLQRVYAVFYAMTTIIGPLATIVANKSLVQDIQKLLTFKLF